MPSRSDVYYYTAFKYAMGRGKLGNWSIFNYVVEKRLGWVREAVLSGECPICGTRFQSVSRVRRHLARSDCRAAVKILVNEAVEEYARLRAMCRKVRCGRRNCYKVQLPTGEVVKFKNSYELVSYLERLEDSSVF